MLNIVGGVLFAVALIASVMIHEGGHFITARRAGMKVTEYFLGFGPTLLSWRRGETEYGVKALPLGGYVRIVGMSSEEEIDPADEPRAFINATPTKQAIVLASGPLTHFVIAGALFIAAGSLIGTTVPSLTVAAVSPCVPATDAATCTPTSPASPAADVGMKPGDTVLTFNGEHVSGWQELTTLIRSHGGQTVTLTVQRGSQVVTLTPTLATAERTALTGPAVSEKVGVLGVSPGTTRSRQNPLTALGSGLGQSISGTFAGIASIPGEIPKLFSGAPRTASSGAASTIGIGQIAGDIVAAPIDWWDRISSFLLLVASVNVFVGLANLIPLVPFDGGKLAVLGYERARAAIYRASGRRDPGRVDLAKLAPASYLVLAVVMGLSVILLVADLVNPIQNPFGG